MPPRHAPRSCSPPSGWTSPSLRYENWDEVIHYCRYSAMPVGRFMLDVHGESASTWAASDALCAGLQINNHLQDCGKDFRDLNRVYLPRDALAAAGASRRGARRARNIGAAAAMPACARGADRDVCSTRAERSAPRSGISGSGSKSPVIQAFADKIVGDAESARSAQRARASVARSNCSPYSLGGIGERGRARRAVGTRPVVKTGGRRMTRGGGRQRELRRHRVRQFVLRGDAHPAARAARGDVPDLQLLPAGRRHRGFRRPARRARSPRSSNGATTSTRCIGARPPAR